MEPHPLLEPRKPTVITDGGPWAAHDMVCPVCQRNHAVLELHVGHYAPCWDCQRDGYLLVRVPPRWRRLARRWADVMRWDRRPSWWQEPRR